MNIQLTKDEKETLEIWCGGNVSLSLSPDQLRLLERFLGNISIQISINNPEHSGLLDSVRDKIIEKLYSDSFDSQVNEYFADQSII